MAGSAPSRATDPGPDADPQNLAGLADALEGVLQAPLMAFMFSARGLDLLLSAMTRTMGRLPRPDELALVYKFVTKRDLEIAECTLTVATPSPASVAALAPWLKRLSHIKRAHSLLYAWESRSGEFCTVKLIGASTLDSSVKPVDIALPARAADALVAQMPGELTVLSRHERRGVRLMDVAHWAG